MTTRWLIGDKCRGEVLFFTGLNFSGQRMVVRLLPGGRWQGDEVDGTRVKSFGIIGPYGLRVTLSSAASPLGWEKLTWRSVTLLEEHTFTSQAGKPAVQVPDLDVVDAFDARRTDESFRQGYPLVDRLADGDGWTFGGRGAGDLKCNVRTIRIDNLRADQE